MSRVRVLVAALVLGAGAALACSGGPPPPPPHGLVLVLLDTLRADGLGVYGNPRPASPEIDALARRGVVFENVVSNAPWTLPGVIGLLSGDYPSRRVFARGQVQVSLVEALREAGYATAAFTEGVYVSSYFGMDRGFGSFWEEEGTTRLVVDDTVARGRGGIERTFHEAGAWLEQHADEPFFLLVHTYEVHVPYRRTTFARDLPRGVLDETYEEREVRRVRKGRLEAGPVERAYVRALYDGGVREADRHVGELVATLERLGVADRTVVAVTSDHGESLGERDPQELGVHKNLLYGELLHVPLVLVDPRQAWPVSRVGAQVRLVDVMPTLLDLAGVPVPPGGEGRSLLPLLRGEESAPRPAYAELRHAGPPRFAWSDGVHKLIVNAPRDASDDPRLELYDLSHDPEERFNLARALPAQRERLLARLRARREQIRETGAPDLAVEEEAPEALRERLRALGYLD